MKLSEIIDALQLEPLVFDHDVDISGGYSADLLSDVVGNVGEDSLLLTVQVHKNIVAVANLVGLGGVIITHRRQPEDDLVTAARENGVNILLSDESSFTVAGRLYASGLRSA